jgi:hypothetical protein
VQAIGHEGDEDVGLDAALELVVDRTEVEVVLQRLEGGLDLDELDVEAPEVGGIAAAQVGAQQIAAFAAAGGPQLVAVDRVGEPRVLGIDGDGEQPPGGGEPGPGRS